MRYRGVGSFASATLVSRILGLIRESTIAYILGASNLSDAFYVAFRIPNLLRDIFAENAVQSALIPTYFKAKENGRGEEFLGATLLFTLGSTLLFTILGITFANLIVTLFAYGFRSDPFKFQLTVKLTKITFPYLWLISFAAFLGGVLNIYRKFFVPALAPSMFNLGVIVTAIVGYRVTGSPLKALFFVGAGVLVGGGLHALFEVPFVLKERVKIRFRGFKIPEFNSFLKLLTPVFLNTGFTRLTLFVNTFIASFLRGGSISYLNFAFRIMQLPIGLFGVGVSTVVNPDLSEKIAKNEDPSREIMEGVRLSLLLTLPFLAIFIADAKGIISIIYQRGHFGTVALENTSLALIFYSFAIVPNSISKIFLSFFFARNNASIPNRVFAIGTAVNIIFSVILALLIGFSGLALATSIGSLTQLGLLFMYANPLISKEREDYLVMAKIFVVNLALFFLFLPVIKGLRWDVIIDSAVFSVVYIPILMALRVPEARKILHIISTLKSTS